MHLYSWALTLYGTVTEPLDGLPENGTIGGYCNEAVLCTDGTKCLQDSNVCVDCSVAGHRVVNNFCAKDGYGYCDENITCQVENAWCNAENVCESCGTGYHELDGVCKQDGALGGYCDALTVCVDSGVACDSSTERCVICNNGYHIIGTSCIEDGVQGGYCDTEIPCFNTNNPDASCDPSSNVCIDCYYAANHRILDGFCIEDGTLGGFCSSEVSCTTTGSGCDPESSTCITCTMNGYRSVRGYCRQDGVVDGYCDTSLACYDGAGCAFQSNVCINCSSTGYRVLPDGYCRQDGMVDGYCDEGTPCMAFSAGCLPSFNVCAICYAGHTLINGYCIEDEEVPETRTVDKSSNAGTIAGVVIAGFIMGVVINGIVFLIALHKAIVAKTGYAPKSMKDKLVYIFQFRKYIFK